MSTYQPNIPTGLVELDQDYLNLQRNFSQINTTYGVDHVALTNNSGVPPVGINGMHTVVHLTTQAVDPLVNTSSGQFYNKVSTIPPTYDQLFYLTNAIGALPAQLSGSRATTNGYGWFAGMLLQWGFVGVTTTTTSRTLFVTANVNFPTTCLFATATPTYNSNSGIPSGSSTNIYIDNNSVAGPNQLNDLGFSWRFVTNSSNVTGFFWVAIGN